MGTAPPTSNEGGFSPLLLVKQEGGQHMLLRVRAVGWQLRRRGENTAIQTWSLGESTEKNTKCKKKHSSNLTIKIRFFLHFWCTSSFEWRGFSPSPSSWARRGTAPTPSSWGSGGTALDVKGEDCNSRLDHLVSQLKKNTKQKNHSSNLTVKMQNFANCNFSITGAQPRRSYILTTRFVLKEMSKMFLHKTHFLNDLFLQIALFSIAGAQSCRSHQRLISLLILQKMYFS